MPSTSEDEGALDRDAPISTREFLAWGTAERKARRTSTVWVSVILGGMLAIISTSTIIDTSISRHAIDLEVQNQKTFSALRATRTEAFGKNEIRVCRALRDTIENQRSVVAVLAYDQLHLAFPTKLLAENRRKTVKLLIDRITKTGLPGCDGFPEAPVTSP